MKKIKTIVFSVAVVCVSLFLCSTGCKNAAGGSSGGDAPTSSMTEAEAIAAIENLNASSPMLNITLTGVTSISVELRDALRNAPEGKINLDLSQTGMTSIGDGAFWDCTSLASVYVKATTPPTLGHDVFNNTSANLKIYVPVGKVDEYKSNSQTGRLDDEIGWKLYDDKIVANPNS